METGEVWNTIKIHNPRSCEYEMPLEVEGFTPNWNKSGYLPGYDARGAKTHSKVLHNSGGPSEQEFVTDQQLTKNSDSYGNGERKFIGRLILMAIIVGNLTGGF